MWWHPRTSLPKKKRRLVGRSLPVRGRVVAWLITASRRPSLAGMGPRRL